MKKSLDERIADAVREEISIVPYNPDWPGVFEQEAEKLLGQFPPSLILRIEHYGSTSIPGMPAKPIIDILVEVPSLDVAKLNIVPVLESEGYDYFWRPTSGDPEKYYCWFIKRGPDGVRTHHIHMVEKDSKLWDDLYFRDFLKEFPDEAKRYGELKVKLALEHPNDRIAYHEGKTKYVVKITGKAKSYFSRVGAGEA